jgi:tetratricopeptide (TPR) repeat protein
LLVFSLLMLVRYQVPFRHEVEEFVLQRWNENLARPAGWAMLLLPLLTWVAAGWIAVWWIVITFRFMRRGERVAATALLCASLVAVPAYRLGVTVYGTTADPAVRTTLASAGGEYDPDRVLRLRQLVGAHPYDPVYRFLLAGLFKNGRYFEEAFSEYKAALDIDPTLVSGYINLGNIFYTTGQYAEAVVNYRQALEYEPDSILAYFNLHLAQSEMFRFTEAEETLDHARSIDSAALAEMLALAGTGTDRTAVMDASIGMSSVWEAALGGSRSDRRAPTASGPAMAVARMVNPIGVVSIGALMACLLVLLVGSRSVARRCIRCGGPFCHYCKSGREGQEYCSQCLHLFVLGDGLAHAAKSRKLYDVERYERWVRRSRRLLSLVLPGSAQILRGRALTGCLILLAWLAALVAWQPAALLPLEKVMGLDIGLDLLRPAHVPALYGIDPFAFLALVSLPLLWLTGNLWRLRRREA